MLRSSEPAGVARFFKTPSDEKEATKTIMTENADGTCDFTGTISFIYCEEYEENKMPLPNDLSLSADVAFTIVYVR